MKTLGIIIMAIILVGLTIYGVKTIIDIIKLIKNKGKKTEKPKKEKDLD